MPKRLRPSIARTTPPNRILYVQFTDPALYPPLEHSSRILASRGWEVLFLGRSLPNGEGIHFPSHTGIQVKLLPAGTTGWRLKVHYAYFFMWTLYWALRWRPRWIYASDPLACPIVWPIQKLCNIRVLYHEHDAPGLDYLQSIFTKLVLACRKHLGRDAALCVVPQAERLQHFIETTSRTGPTFCVWNCPRRAEVQQACAPNDQPLILYYHGSIGRGRLPLGVVVAATRFKGAVRLRIAGYETVGSIGYIRELISVAAQHGYADIVEVLGSMPRSVSLRHASRAHVGLSFVPKNSEDTNLRQMVGASNKSFDYMACGLPLLVSDLSDWTSTFVQPGFGLSCDPDDPDSVFAALQWFLDHRAERRQMGRKGQDKISLDWNYETMFAKALSAIEDG